MIDAVNIVCDVPSSLLPIEVSNRLCTPFVWQDMDFYPNGEFGYLANKPSLNALGFGNLRVKFDTKRSPIIRISNSLHKVYDDDGNNYGDFTKSQLLDTIDYLSFAFGLPKHFFCFTGKFEFSVNLKVDNAQRVINNCHRLNKNIMRAMVKKHKEYGKKAITSNYAIKLYNPIQKLLIENPRFCKSAQIVDNNNLVRFEVEVNSSYLQRNWKIPIYSFDDFCIKANFNRLGDKLYHYANSLIFNDKPQNMTYREHKVWSFFMNATKEELQVYRKCNKSTFYRDKKVFEELKSKENILRITQKVREKWTFLSMN